MGYLIKEKKTSSMRILPKIKALSKTKAKRKVKRKIHTEVVANIAMVVMYGAFSKTPISESVGKNYYLF